MSTITDFDDLVNRLTGGNSGTPESVFWFKDNNQSAAAMTAPVAGRICSLWRNDGSPSGGSAPGAVAVPTRATAGALVQANPGGGRQKWLLCAMASSPVSAGELIIYDRLLHIGGLSGTTITAQTVGGTMTRYATNNSCIGNQIWVEIYTAIGGTSRTITASYTNQAGSSGQTSVAADIGNTGFNESSRMIQIPLAEGDTGVQAVASVTLSASTGTAGNFGVTVLRPLAVINLPPATGTGSTDFIEGFPNVQEVLTDACLAVMFVSLSTTALRICGQLSFVEK